MITKGGRFPHSSDLAFDSWLWYSYDTTDCSVLRTLTILKTCVIRSFFFEKWLLTHVLADTKAMNTNARHSIHGFGILVSYK